MAAETNTPQVVGQDVKGCLLPTSPFENFLENLIERLPRQRKTVTLKPIQDIEILSATKNQFKSTGNTPTFAMDLAGGPKSGWYYLEAALTRNNGSRVARIVIDLGHCKKTQLIPSILRGSVREVIFLPDDVSQLSWIPTAAPGFFSQSPLQIHKIGSIESFFRRIYRVIYDLWKFRYTPPAERGGLIWTGVFSDLQNTYENSAKLRIQRVSGNDYTAFIARYDTLKLSDICQINSQIKKLLRYPVFSILMPLHEAITQHLGASLSSITGQIYDKWELIIACSPGLSESTLAVVHSAAGKDPRIKVVFFEPSANLGVETADLLNCALAEAEGEWVIRVNPHDCLPRHSIFNFVSASNLNPETLFIYGDDDQIDIDGRRTAHRFKPDWNLDLLTSHDYIGNPVAYCRARLLEFGGYAKKFEGAEGYELSLRYLKELPDCRIQHIHKILYHHHTSPAYLENIQRGHDAGRRALECYFDGTGITVEEGAGATRYRVKHPINSPAPLVSIIVPTRDKLSLLQTCVEGIQKNTNYPAWELLIVDNGSVEAKTLNYFHFLQNDNRIKVLSYKAPFNYSAINNYAVAQAQGDVLVLLNNDIEVISNDWLHEMVSHAIRPEIGAVGAKLLYPDGTVQHAGVILGIGGVAGHVHRFLAGDAPGYCNRAVQIQNLSAVTGACLAVRKKLYQEVGGLNEDHLHVAFNDIDFCLKLLDAGYKNVFTPFALLHHHESISRGPDDTPEKKEIFKREFDYMKSVWQVRLQSDFAYNKNLTLDVENFSLKM